MIYLYYINNVSSMINDNYKNEKICFIKYIGENNNGNEYEFYFSQTLDNFWGDDFNVKPCFLLNDLIPYDDTYDMIKRITLNHDIKLDLASEDSCHSFQDCIDNVIALAAQNIDNIDYPKEGRLIFYFGENYNSIEKKLSIRNTFFLD